MPVTRELGEKSLVKALGVWGLAASILNLTIGGGIFRLPATAAGALGSAAPVAYVVCAIAMGLIVVCFAEAGSRVSLTGGLYAYVEVAFGPLVGFLCGVLLWAGITAATAAVSSFFADALGALIPAIASGTARAVAITVIVVILAVINIAGVRGASRFNALMTVSKLVPLVVLIVVGIGAMRSENLRWTSTPAATDVARASVITIFAFLGVESALIPSGEVVDPARTVPRAIAIAMIGVTLLYLAVQVVTQGILGPDLATQKTPLAEAAGRAIGDGGRTLILVGSAISMFGYVSGMILAGPRMLYAFGRDRFLPSQLAMIHPRFKTPHVAIATHAVVVIVLAASGTFEKLAVIANGSILLVYAACCLAVIQLRRRNIQESGVPFRAPFASVIPILAIAAIGWLLTSLSGDEWKSLVAVVGVAIIVFASSLPARRTAAAVGQL
jgi:APA family basic amino acid/polyamine antiporter